MIKFFDSDFYRLIQEFFLNNDKKTFIQFLGEFYNRTEGIINKNEMQDELIKELREMFLLFNQKGIDENIVREKVDNFIQNNSKIQNIFSELNTKVDLNIINNVLKTSYKDKPIVTLLDDDCSREFLSIIKPELDKRGLKCSMAMITSKVGDSDTLSLEELKQLQNNGFDILCHSHTHSYDIYKSNILTQADSVIENDIKLSQNFMRSNGFDLGAETLVYPFGNYTYEESLKIKSITKKYFTNCIDANGGIINKFPYDNGLIPRKIFEFKQASNLDYAKQLIDECKNNNSWFILGTHAWSNVTQSMYGEMLDYLIASGITVMTFSQALKYKGNVLSVGEYTSNSKMFISSNGNIETSINANNIKTPFPQNLLKQSESFSDLYWSENNSSVLSEIRKNGYKGNDVLVLKESWQGRKQSVYLEKNKVVIYASRTKSVNTTAKTIIHELKHMEINMPNSRWQEKMCYIEEKLFEKGTDTLTDDELLSIIIHIDKEYPWLPEE